MVHHRHAWRGTVDIAGCRHNDHVGSVGSERVDPMEDLEAGHIRQVEVQQDEVGAHALDCL